jgi:hypothetical protein
VKELRRRPFPLAPDSERPAVVPTARARPLEGRRWRDAGDGHLPESAVGSDAMCHQRAHRIPACRDAGASRWQDRCGECRQPYPLLGDENMPGTVKGFGRQLDYPKSETARAL